MEDVPRASARGTRTAVISGNVGSGLSSPDAHYSDKGKSGTCNVPPPRRQRTGKGLYKSRHGLDRSHVSNGKQKKG